MPILLAFVPQDVFYSVNADVFSPLLFVVSLTLLLTWCRRERPGAALSAGLGLLVALTFLAKYTNLPLPAIFGVALLFKLRRRGWDARRAVLIARLAALLPVVMWLGRNYILFGDFTGTQSKILAVEFTRRPLGAWLAHPIFTPRGLWTFWAELMRTFWRGELVWHLKRIASPAVDMF